MRFIQPPLPFPVSLKGYNGGQLDKIEEKVDRMFDKLDNLLDICQELSGNIPQWVRQKHPMFMSINIALLNTHFFYNS